MTPSTLPKHRAAPPPRWWRTRRTAVALGVVLSALVVLLGGPKLLKFMLLEQLGNEVARVPDVFTPLDAVARPPENSALTFLLVGTDTRSDSPTTGTGAGGDGLGRDRSDVLMIVRIDPSRTNLAVVSIPRDSWVEIPGHGMNKINAAYAYGGPSLLIQTVELLTAIRIDHLAVIDFAGFQAMVDAVGGIDVSILEATSQEGVQFHEGLNHLDGYAALKFVRQRHGLVNGDLDRAQREQSALRALLVKAVETGMLSDLGGLYRLINAATQSIGVDETLSSGRLRVLVSELRKLQASDVQFVRAPVTGFGREGPQSVDYLDPRARELWTALRSGGLDAYLLRHGADVLGSTTR
jgi:LCP family protein required for cell wall assembly